MNPSTQIASHLRAVYFGGNWTSSNLKQHLVDVTWQQATTQVHGLNTIATLVFHLNYYVHEVTKVLQGEPLTASDKYAFMHPPIKSEEDWQKMLDQVWTDGETFATLIGQMPENQVWEDFIDPKYGNWFRNLEGIIEHIHYHLGQIVVLKKMLPG
jgi:hypothetical protein